MSTLHFVPRPLPEESPFSLLRRTVVENGYKNCRTFLTSKISENFFVSNPMLQDSEFAELLCRHAGEFSGEIKQAFYSLVTNNHNSTRILINNVAINPKLVRHWSSAICTDCIKEGWERKIKDILPAENCPYHYKQYISICPNCHRKLGWPSQPVTICKCKKPLISPPCSESDVAIEKKLLSLLRSESQDTFNIFSEILLGLGYRKPNHPPKDRRTIVEIALSICLGAPEESARLLINFYKITPPLNKSFIVAKLSPFTPKEHLNRIANALAQIDNSVQCYAQVPTTLSVKQIYIYLNLTFGEWERIRTHKDFPHRKRWSLYTPRDIKAITQIHQENCMQESRQHEESFAHKTLTLQEAAHYLKISEVNLRELTSAKLIAGIIKTHDKPYRIPLSSIKNFKMNYITLQQIAIKLNRPAKYIRKSILQLNIETFPLPHGSKYTIVISREDLDKIRHHDNARSSPFRAYKRLSLALPTAPLDSRSDFYTTGETQQYLKLNRSVVCQLVRCKILRSFCTGRCSEYLINKDEIYDFHKNYITPKEASELLQTPLNLTTKLLIDCNVLPCTGRHVDGEQVTLFLRKDITSEVQTKLTHKHSAFGRYRTEHLLIQSDKAATLLGLSRHSFVKIKRKIAIPTRQKHYQTRTQITPEEMEKIRLFLQEYQPTHTILDSTWLTRRQFNELFILNDLVTEVVINRIPHITKEDAQRLIEFTDNYCTCQVADRILNAPRGHTRFAVLSKSLQPATPLGDVKFKHILLDRKQIESMTYVRKRHCRKKIPATPVSIHI